MTPHPALLTILTFLGAVLLALALVPAARRAAFALGVLDRPDHKLKKHGEPTPYLGGVAIFAACVAAVLAAKAATTGTPRGVVGILAGGTIVFLLGLFDDFRPLRPGVKLAFQVLAACVPVWFGVHIKFIENPWGYIPLTVAWIVGVTNAFNLLDIMDGLAATVAVSAATWFWLISLEHGRMNDAITAAALAGAALGFLRYNRPPARIFMGDAGSLFLGFTLASVAIGQGYSMNTNLGVIAPVLILGIPVFETLFVMAVRRQQGKPVMKGSPDHIALRLRKIGYTVPGVLGALGGASAVLGALAYVVVHVNWERALLIAVAAGFASVLAAIRLASIRMP